ncbi:MAG: phage gp6-like head-tail connector protein [Bacteroidales bacterium]|nr:phage gp6-like head-tail connector protein [Bacteroidales bacterium]
MDRERLPEQISLEVLKAWLYVDGDALDEKLRLCLAAAITQAETYTGLVLQPSRFTFSGPFDNRITLSVRPVTGIVAVTVDGRSLTAEEFSLDCETVVIDSSVSGEKAKVVFTAGEAPMPDDIRMAILKIAADFFQNPDDQVRQLPTASQLLLRPYRVNHV